MGNPRSCSVWERSRQHYPPLNRADGAKLERKDVERTCRRVVDRDLDTQLVADQFEISRRRVQQLARDYRESGEIPQLETPGRNSCAEHPPGLEARIFSPREQLGLGVAAVAQDMRDRDDLSIDNNVVHGILKEYEHVSEKKTNRGAADHTFESTWRSPSWSMRSR